MKIALGSDLHLEFGPLDVKNRENAEVLILSGDICVAQDFAIDNSSKEKCNKFFGDCSKEFEHVVYVMGNHEHYHGEFKKTLNILRENITHSNVHILEKEKWEYKDYTFVGGTLWTDCNKENPNTIWALKSRMNDYHIVDIDGVRLLPEYTIGEHYAFVDFIDETTKDNTKKYIVVGHHAPSRRSIKEKYKYDHNMNGGYNSDLEEFIINRPQIKIWTHGHTHEDFDYMVGETRVICNPRGYVGYEHRANDWDFKYFDV